MGKTLSKPYLTNTFDLINGRKVRFLPVPERDVCAAVQRSGGSRGRTPSPSVRTVVCRWWTQTTFPFPHFLLSLGRAQSDAFPTVRSLWGQACSGQTELAVLQQGRFIVLHLAGVPLSMDVVGFWKALCCCCERGREKPSVLAVCVPNRKAPLSCGTRLSRGRGPKRGGPACLWLFALCPRRAGPRPQENGSARPRCSVLCFSRSAELLVPRQDKHGVCGAGCALGPRRRREDLPGSSAVPVFADRRTRRHGRGVAVARAER